MRLQLEHHVEQDAIDDNNDEQDKRIEGDVDAIDIERLQHIFASDRADALRNQRARYWHWQVLSAMLPEHENTTLVKSFLTSRLKAYVS